MRLGFYFQNSGRPRQEISDTSNWLLMCFQKLSCVILILISNSVLILHSLFLYAHPRNGHMPQLCPHLCLCRDCDSLFISNCAVSIASILGTRAGGKGSTAWKSLGHPPRLLSACWRLPGLAPCGLGVPDTPWEFSGHQSELCQQVSLAMCKEEFTRCVNGKNAQAFSTWGQFFK